MLPTAEDVVEAGARIAGRVRQTPLLTLAADTAAGVPLVLKLEQLQHTGSFKPRGAFNTLLAAKVGSEGVICASGGNHGIAVAYAARELGVPAEVFVPLSSSPVKVKLLRALGAKVRQVGSVYAEALAAMTERQASTGALEVHAYDQPAVIAGQGTLFAEWLQQDPQLDTVVVAVGGGGLLGGALAAIGDRVRLVAVEPHRAPTLASALDAGEPVDVEVSGLAADSLGARRIGRLAFELARARGVVSLTVGDDEIRAAQHWLWSHARIVTEPGGAAAVAAVLGGHYRTRPGERIGVLICGANADLASLAA
ncbi:MAG: threonine/serine dehydratase [Geminicoccaceae bacterium]|nr:MAG: threonine/serine dehydratase [Geminicoccaceae bacterium]